MFPLLSVIFTAAVSAIATLALLAPLLLLVLPVLLLLDDEDDDDEEEEDTEDETIKQSFWSVGVMSSSSIPTVIGVEVDFRSTDQDELAGWVLTSIPHTIVESKSRMRVCS
jgi:cadmium resistance protein CadD (predicted permease)